MRSFRDQRLSNDYDELMRLRQQLNQSDRTMLEVQPVGSRPYQAYNLVFHCAGYADEFGSLRQRHQVFLEFPKAYPMEAPPTFKRVSPLFHPNIYPHGVFCLGFEAERKWRPGISLESLILHVSRLVRFDPDWVNLDPPANRTQSYWEEFMKKVRLPADQDPFVVGEEPTVPTGGRQETARTTTAPPPSRRPIRIEAGPTGSSRRRMGPRLAGRPRTIGPIRIKRNNPSE